jgi:hypothetical protein
MTLIDLQVPESLLDKVEIVSLEHARKIMDIVCQLAYSGHSQAEMLRRVTSTF